MISRLAVDVPPLPQEEKAANRHESSDWVLDAETFDWLLGSRVEPAPLNVAPLSIQAESNNQR